MELTGLKIDVVSLEPGGSETTSEKIMPPNECLIIIGLSELNEEGILWMEMKGKGVGRICKPGVNAVNENSGHQRGDVASFEELSKRVL